MTLVCEPNGAVIAAGDEDGQRSLRSLTTSASNVLSMSCSRGQASSENLHVYAPMPQSVQNKKVNEAYERLLRSDVKYRFSIDMASLKSESAEHERARASERQVAAAGIG